MIPDKFTPSPGQTYKGLNQTRTVIAIGNTADISDLAPTSRIPQIKYRGKHGKENVCDLAVWVKWVSEAEIVPNA